MKKVKPHLFLPLLLFVLLGAFLFNGLWLDPRKLPSALIGKPVPDSELPVLAQVSPAYPGVSALDVAQLKGAPWVLNVFASWCGACVAEHPHLIELARQGKIQLVGLAYKDDPADTARWLNHYGNPYSLVLIDRHGQFGIDLGVYGVPETFLIDEGLTIAHKHVGPIAADYLKTVVQPTLGATP